MSITFIKNYYPLAVPLLIVATGIFIANSSIFQQDPGALSLGIMIDMLLVSPVVYFLLIRKKDIPNTTVVPVAVAGLLICSSIIPLQHQSFLPYLKEYALPVLELCVISFILFKVHGIRRSYKKINGEKLDFLEIMRKASANVFPGKIGEFLAYEVSIFYYLLFGWKKKNISGTEFSYHKESGTVAILWVLVFLVLAETAIFHILLSQWSSLAAWVLTILSIYSGFVVLGLIASMKQVPHEVHDEMLILRYGLFGRTSIPYKKIKSIESNSADLKSDIITLSPLGSLEQHNILIQLHDKHEVRQLYGVKKNFISLAFYVDKKDEFIRMINCRIGSLN